MNFMVLTGQSEYFLVSLLERSEVAANVDVIEAG